MRLGDLYLILLIFIGNVIILLLGQSNRPIFTLSLIFCSFIQWSSIIINGVISARAHFPPDISFKYIKHLEWIQISIYTGALLISSFPIYIIYYIFHIVTLVEWSNVIYKYAVFVAVTIINILWTLICTSTIKNILTGFFATNLTIGNSQRALDYIYYFNPYVKYLTIEGDNIEHLNVQFPKGLLSIRAYNMPNLTEMPKTLPDTLEGLILDNVDVTRLPKNLPMQLLTLFVLDTPLNMLPEILPSTLSLLVLCNTQLAELPDIPDTILDINISINYVANPLLQSFYPRLGNVSILNVKDKIKYINFCNMQRRAQTRMRIINRDGAFLEHYMRRMMHPDRLAALKCDPNIDVDDFMTRYVDSL